MAKKQERLIQTRLGEMTITPDKILIFPKGLIGYQDKREFTLIQVNEESPFMLLQSMDDPEFALLVTDPYIFVSEYTVKISGAEQKLVQLDSPKQMGVLVTVSIPKGRPDETTLNLIGPIILNTRKKLGVQVPQTDLSTPSNIRLEMRQNPAKSAGDGDDTASPDKESSGGD